MTTFLITGATGRLGGAALRSLIAKVPATDVHVLVRTPDAAIRLPAGGLTAHLADYSDPAGLVRAFTGIDRLLFVSSPVLDPAIRSAQHRTVVESAIAAGVRHIVYTSAMGAPHDPGHTAAEVALAEGGVSHTILRNALYTDPFIERALEDARAGVVRSASENHPIVTASIADLADAAVAALLAPPERALWEVRGPSWTFDGLAEVLSRLTGRVIRHDHVADAATGPFAVLFPLVRRDVFAVETTDLGTILGRPPRTIEAVAAEQLRV